MLRGPYSSGYAALREQLVAARKAAGLTQVEVAKGIGRSQSFVAKYELGERRLDVIEFVLVCQFLGVDSSNVLQTLQRRLS